MSWSNIHKWIVRHCDDEKPNLAELEEYLQDHKIYRATTNGNTVLHFAVLGKSEVLLNYLLKIAPPNLINQQNLKGETPLLWASSCSSVPVYNIKQLVRNGADERITDIYGNSVLHAATRGNFAALKFFLKRGKVDINAENYSGDSPLDIAFTENEPNRITCLIQAGASVTSYLNKCFSENNSRGAFKVLKFVPQVVDNSGRTPLHLAVRNNNYRAAKKILKYYPHMKYVPDKDGNLARDYIPSCVDKKITTLNL